MKDSTTTLVLFFDDLDLVEPVEAIVGVYFERVIKVDIRVENKKLSSLCQAAHKRMLLVYCFQEVSHAESLKNFLQSNEHFNTLRTVPHASMLLCEKNNRNDAFQLCCNETFDSYDTIRPVYDNHKIILTLYKLIEIIELKAELKRFDQAGLDMQYEMQNTASQLQGLHESVKVASKQQSSLITNIMQDVDGILSSISESAFMKSFRKVFHALPDEEINKFIHELRKHSINPQLNRLKEKSESLFNELSTQLLAQKAALEKKDNLRKATVVVADDQDVVLKIIATILEQHGYKVEKASNGVEVLLKAKVLKPDLILLDIDMPILDGIETLKVCKKTPVLQDIPLIMLTSYADVEHFQNALLLGAEDYIIKPTNAETLLKKIRSVLN
ncbi:response regulator [Shewanella sedimentimangrovi]|uniref:Response regulator n=1 Tax=Shewanella sedimentimangrovi TaxID=2814293 RepID=A0ABX7QW37_9GAMM|nr:response regulator [Shewanella sedimentimangrovi]QSX35649.1 response regulator [Shewanella sedimentimangrovi]